MFSLPFESSVADSGVVVFKHSMTGTLKEQLLQLTVAVETAITLADYSTYRRHVDPAASFFEPRTRGTLLQV